MQKADWGYQERGLGGWGLVFIGTEFQFGKMKAFWEWVVGVATQQCPLCH